MDSLLANYVSSDEEEEEHQRQQQPLPPLPRPQAQSSARSSTLRSVYTDPSSSSSSSSKTSPLFHSLPQPKSSSSLFQSLPNPKSSSKPSLPTPCFDNKGKEELEESVSTIRESSAAASSSLFSSLPIPNSKRSLKNTANPFSSQLQTKRLAQFNPPTTPFSTQSTEVDEDEDSDEEERERRRKKESKSQPQALSGTAFISSIIPAPRRSATLGTLPSSGSGRRSILETEPPVTTPNASSNEATDSGNIDHQNASSYYTESSYYNPKNYDSSNDQNAWNYASYDNTYSNYQNVDGQVQSGLSGSENVNYENYGSYGDYGQQYGSSSMVGTEVSASVESSVRVSEKRRRNEIPTEIIEVKQDELMKNRPREDQVKLTGIAFGPSYQAVSAKGKPSKLHKRKHQISSLYFDMRQKETELAERRAKGHLTKAETQAKYGW